MLPKCLLYPLNLGEVVTDMLDAQFQQLFERVPHSIGILPDPLKLLGSQIFEKRQHAGPQHLEQEHMLLAVQPIISEVIRPGFLIK